MRLFKNVPVAQTDSGSLCYSLQIPNNWNDPRSPDTHTWGGGVLIPVESLLVLDLQDGGVVVQDGQDDFVHVLPQA